MKGKIVLHGKYRQKGTGKVGYIYRVEAADDVVSAVKDIKGETFAPTDAKTGKTILFMNAFEGAERKFSITEKGSIVLADTEASMFEELANSSTGAMSEHYAKLAYDAKAKEVRALLAAQDSEVRETEAAPGTTI